MVWEKGKSGNPGGRPREHAEIKALAQVHGKDAIAVLVALLKSKDERSRLAAAQAILDRGYGKPSQPIGGDADNPLQVMLASRLEDAIKRKGE